MAHLPKDLLALFSKNYRSLDFKSALCGFERECLRVDKQGKLAQTAHPEPLGAALTHPYLTTDFSEAQLELITPPCKSEKRSIAFLGSLHRYVSGKISPEMTWPFSTPPVLPKEGEIPIAYYGESEAGALRRLYRLGLSFRYGRRMQTLSGIHYNFSFSKNFWDTMMEGFNLEKVQDLGREVSVLEVEYSKATPDTCSYESKDCPFSPDSTAVSRLKEERKEFISEAYFCCARNYLRFSWLNTYLFGATPVVDRTFFDSLPKEFEQLDPDTFYLPYATSLRTSRYGYYSKVQSQTRISYNSLHSYLHDLTHALETPSALYSQADIPEEQKYPQISENILQIPAEHYTKIRPKPKVSPLGAVLEDLRKNGVEYLETRDLDVNPFTIEGIELDQIYFLTTFLYYCLFKESPSFTSEEEAVILGNQDKVALCGRKPGLELDCLLKGKVGLVEWASEILDEMEPVAHLLDRSFADKRYSRALNSQRKKVLHPYLTPSARIIEELKEKKVSYRNYGLFLSQLYAKQLSQEVLSETLRSKLDTLAVESFQKQKEREVHEDFLLKGYEDMEVSTQLIIREAKKRKVKVEILDRKDCFLRLSKDGHVEYIKKASCTSLDSYITFLQMENKAVSKQILKENGFTVPTGEVFYNKREAVSYYEQIKDKKIVVKPVFTNFGIGVHIIPPNHFQQYEEALNDGFSQGDEVIVEEFFPGEEYRFLIIGNRVSAICQRLPANVIGDGIHTIKELIKIKNNDPYAYKVPKYRIRHGKVEKEYLARQGLTLSAVPKTGERIFLRENSNVATGGDPIDATDSVHESYKEIALHAAQSVDAQFCGLDLIIPNKSMHANADNYTILELNFNPAIFLHRYPLSGRKIHVEEEVLDLLGFNGVD